MKNRKECQSLRTIFIGIVLIGLALVTIERISAQCIDDASHKTAVKLSNQTKYDLMFGIDEDDKGTVPSGKVSPEWEVNPGDHLLIAGAVIDGHAYWVWTENEVLKGQICTWIIEDPKESTANKKALHSNIWYNKHFAYGSRKAQHVVLLGDSH